MSIGEVGDAAPEVVEGEAAHELGVGRVVEALVVDLDRAVDDDVAGLRAEADDLGVVADLDLQRLGLGAVHAGLEEQGVAVAAHLGADLRGVDGVDGRLDLADRHARVEHRGARGRGRGPSGRRGRAERRSRWRRRRGSARRRRRGPGRAGGAAAPRGVRSSRAVLTGVDSFVLGVGSSASPGEVGLPVGARTAELSHAAPRRARGWLGRLRGGPTVVGGGRSAGGERQSGAVRDRTASDRDRGHRGQRRRGRGRGDGAPRGGEQGRRRARRRGRRARATGTRAAGRTCRGVWATADTGCSSRCRHRGAGAAGRPVRRASSRGEGPPVFAIVRIPCGARLGSYR